MKNKKNIFVILMALPFLSMGALRAKEMVEQYQANQAASAVNDDKSEKEPTSPMVDSRKERPRATTRTATPQTPIPKTKPSQVESAVAPKGILDKRADAIRQTRARMLAQATLAEANGDAALAVRLRQHAERLQEGLNSPAALKLEPSPTAREVSDIVQ